MTPREKASPPIEFHQDESTKASVLPVLVWAAGVDPSGTVDGLDDVTMRAAGGECPVPVETREAVRRMLRYGKYKPSGRGKPASEFLLQAAVAGAFPRVNGAVDANNAISLESGLPGSIFDADLTGPQLLLRRGRAGETYVFNPSGQSIDLEDLLVVCRETAGDWDPCGNPVKDSMATKIRPETTRVVAVLYVPVPLGVDVAHRWAVRFAERLEASCRTPDVGYAVVDR